MRIDLLKLAALLLVTVATADVLPILPTKLNSDSGGYYFNTPWAPMAGGGDYAVTHVDDFNSYQIRILKRNNAGYYGHIATKNITFQVKDLSTDGRFITSEDKGRGEAEIFEVDSGGNVINVQTVPSPLNYGKILEDGTFVAITEKSLVTYAYENNKWVQKDETSYGNNRSLIYYGQLWPYQLTTKTFVAAHMDPSADSYVFLMRRNPNLSWTFVDQFSLDIKTWSSPYSMIWDGDDTVILGHPAVHDYGNGTLYGRLVIRVKEGDQWVVKKNFTMEDLEGFKAKGYLGFNMHALTSDSVLVTVPDDGFTETNFFGGAVILLTRNADREWSPKLQFRGEASIGHMGIQARQSARDILILNVGANGGLDGYIYTYAPSCPVQAQQPTCSDAVFDLTTEECAGNTPPSRFRPADYYTLPQNDCNEVLPTTNAFVKQSYGFLWTVTFERDDSIVYACRFKLQCPTPGAPGSKGQFSAASSIQAVSAIFLVLALLF